VIVSRRSAVHLGLLLFVPPSTVMGQRVTASAAVAYLDYRLDAGSGTERLAGLALDVGVDIALLPWLQTAVNVRAGRLEAVSDEGLDRDMGQASLTARGRVAPWLVAESSVLARSFGTTIARQRWIVLRTGFEARFAFLGARVDAIVRGAYLPGVWVNGLDQPGLAFSAATGLEYQLRVVRASLLYELERYTFPPRGTAERAEQLGTLRLEVAFTARE
jgi:hypothetical protein